MATLLRCSMTRRMSSTVPIFNRAIKRQQRNNISQIKNSNEYEYLKDEVSRRLIDRLEDIERDFPLALDLGCGSGHLYKNLIVDDGLGGIKTLLQCDSAESLLLRDDLKTGDITLKTSRLVADEEFLPFPRHEFDLVMSSLALHWVNDLENTFRQVLNVLKPDGAFVAAVLGGDSLQELRSAFILGDQERQGGISPHISPFMNIGDAGNLLSATGFNLCTVDTDYICVEYPNAFVLMEHLRGMGENHAVSSKGLPATRDSLLATASIYQSMFGQPNGTVPATFQVIYLIGWAPHESQQKPLRRGSAQHSLKELGHD
ncbi:Predicted methyltransferase [Plasmopara halstedii]|uniref:Predicted methyltransferase n=1 Tax=Plasmopara halstedii TaxID=4781 RepID=A0A0P1A9K1_PLAHL|nr:Predicted methyltransferase [Plasmopara halstedii]CEG36956.1 Predicted methyltransferase [Plasmopara halstedii]|eukprot:XP_024573325.1 Predicted methyltransferase [Plasmopara halstedii]